MSYKKRVLVIGEASALNTGFSNYYRELLSRLVKTGKYEIGEIASYVRPDDSRMHEFVNGRWQWWGNMPTTQEEVAIFNQPSNHPRDRGQNINQFGANIFDRVCAEFKPDCIIAIRDNWMDSFILRSSFRKWFKFLWLPTVDSPQQSEEWIEDYEKCNLVMAYSDFGVHTLKLQSPKIKLYPKPMRPGVDLQVFKPLNKSNIREKFNLSNDIKIIGLLQRNQSRKMILETIDAFALMKKKFSNHPIIKKAVLLLHTAWPDNAYSFNYPRHIKRLQSNTWMKYHYKGIMSDVLQTLICHNCKSSSVCFAINLHNQSVQTLQINGQNIMGIFMPCIYCGQQTATCPTTGIGHSREQLADIYNLMDFMVQCSIAEGDGMPSTECKACGVPVIVTDHSALSEKGRFPSEYIHFKELGITKENYTINKGGITHTVAAYKHEPETGCLRAIPDIKDLSEKMYLLLTDNELRSKMSEEARECAEENYDWDKLAKQWEYVLDNIKSYDRSKTWDSPVTQHTDIKPIPVPVGLTNEQYIEWLYLNILQYPAVDPNGAQMWLQHLQAGVSREQLMQQFIKIGNQQSNESKLRDQIRSQVLGLNVNNQQEFI